MAGIAGWPQAIDSSQPVNWGHPLNRSRLAWWLAVPSSPSRYGGPTWRDLCAGTVGTLTNMTAGASSGWRGTSRPGGLGELLFDGSNDYVLTPSSTKLSPASITLAAWIKTTTTTAAHAIIDRDDGSTNRVFQWRLDSGVPRFIYFSSGPSLIGTPFASTGVADGLWHRVAVTYDSTSGLVSFYRDGLPDGTSNTGSGALNPISAVATIGIFGDFATDQFAGSLDDLTVAGRAWSAAEIKVDYNLSRQGYPGVLNRVSPLRFALLGSGTSGATGGPFPFFLDQTHCGGFWDGGY